MILNLVLLFVVFGAEKKKISPYLAALLLGVIKAGLYVTFTGIFVAAVIIGVIYAGMAAAFVYFLERVDRREDGDRPAVPMYGSAGSAKVTFRWEYIPIVILLLLIVGGEILLA